MGNRSHHPPTFRLTARAAALCAIGAVLASGAILLTSCILADPPAEVEVPALRRPIIVRESVYPPPTRILRTWPDAFVVVADVDPTQVVLYQESVNGDSINAGQSDPEVGNQDGGLRHIDVNRPIPFTDDCITYEITLAYSFVSNNVPAYPGGDSVSWFYSPTGDLSTCPTFDGGTDASDASVGDIEE